MTDRHGPGGKVVALRRAGLPGVALRLAGMLILGGLCLALLAPKVQAIEGAALWRAIGAVGPWQWLMALGLTGVSFAATGRYDAVLHRHLGTGVDAAQARRAGITAIAVSQMLGLGVISGAILRWRMLPGLSLAQAAALTAAVAASFLAAFAVGTALVLLALPGAPFKAVAAAVLTGAGALAALGLGRRWRRWPNGLTMARLLGLCAVDMLAAAAALAVLLPGAGFATLLPAFLLAFGAGLVAATPGGAGAFEVTLMALLPGVAAPDLLAAVLVWRCIYHALPALLGAALAIRGPLPAAAPLALAPPTDGPTDGPTDLGLAELGLVAQGEHAFLPAGPGSVWLAGRTPHLLVGLLGPAGPAPARCALHALTVAARAEDRLACVYKADARLAAAARRHGWQALRVAAEAVIDPRDFRLAASCRAGLRRKLRRAEAAGVTVEGPAEHRGALPWAAMDRIAANWQAAHGGERGFSMGRYGRSYLAGQRVYLARRGCQVLAFVSFHATAGEWVLDLMRPGPDLPDGTMQALLAAAICEAQAQGLPRLTLAAVPALAVPRWGAAGWLATRLGCHDAGLFQFKAAFAPRWEPRYLLAPGPLRLALAASGIARAIHHPPPLAPSAANDHHEDYEFASAPAPWQEEAPPPTAEGGPCLRINSRSSFPPATG